MKILTLFALVLSLGISNGFGEVYQGLKVQGDFREMELVVEHVSPNKLLTREDIEKAVKLRLFSNNIKTKDFCADYFYVNVTVMPLRDGVNFVYNVQLRFTKRSFSYGVSESVAGLAFAPSQGVYGGIGICYEKDHLLNIVRDSVDSFLVDYIESNMKD